MNKPKRCDYEQCKKDAIVGMGRVGWKEENETWLCEEHILVWLRSKPKANKNTVN